MNKVIYCNLINRCRNWKQFELCIFGKERAIKCKNILYKINS